MSRIQYFSCINSCLYFDTHEVLVNILKQVENRKTQLDAIKTELRARTRCRDDEIRVMAERMRGLEEIVHAQQEQMRLMLESMALSFAFIDKQFELNALTESKFAFIDKQVELNALTASK